MFELLIAGLMQCMLIPDLDEFGQCLDQVVLEINLMEEGQQY